jgi:hypothetical protein
MRVRIRRFRDLSPEGPGVQCRLSLQGFAAPRCSTLLSDPASRRPPLRFAITSPPSGCEKDFHLPAIEHARHTKAKAQPFGRASRGADSSKTSSLRSSLQTLPEPRSQPWWDAADPRKETDSGYSRRTSRDHPGRTNPHPSRSQTHTFQDRPLWH